MDNVSCIGIGMLNRLIATYSSNQPFYWKDNIGDFLGCNEDSMLISDEDILNYLRRIISNEYSLIEIPTERIFQATDKKDNFTYFDTELKIIKND